MTRVSFVFVFCVLFCSLSHGMVQNLKALHFDIEPYTLAAWKTNQTQIFGYYVDLMDKLSAKLAGTGLELVVDVPFWLDKYNYTRDGVTRPYHEWVIDRTDRVASMDYRAYAYTNGQRTDGIVRNGLAYIDYATQVGKKVVIIVETSQQTPDYISFYSNTTTFMEQELALAYQNFSTKSGFDSLCIHHINSWAAMTPDYNVTNGISRDVFQWTSAVATNVTARTNMFEYCKRHNVRSVYLQAESIVKTNQAAVINFIFAAAQYGINVELLFGDNVWAMPNMHDYVLSLVDYSLQVATTLKTLVVDPVSGSDSNLGGPFKTIKGAIAANKGSALSIQLNPGVYNVTSALTLSYQNYTSVRLFAVDPSNTIIRCTSTGYRALIFTTVASVELYGITFTNCADTVSGTGGGAVYASIGTSLNITACKFTHNSGKKGGALSVATTATNSAASLYIRDSVFDSNTAASSSAGALFTSMINTDIRNTNFTNNVAYNSGGAMSIYWEGATGFSFNVTITDSFIMGNKANASGGGIYTYNLNPMLGLKLVNTVVSQNTLYTSGSCQGAGIYFLTGNFLKLENSTVSNNVAVKSGTINTQGGGIYSAFSANTGFLSLLDSSIIGNTADLGAGIMLTNRNSKHDPQHSIINSYFSQNNGTSYSALLNVNCSVLIQETTFENNTVSSTSGATVTGQTGAIISLQSSIITNNVGTGFSCQSSTMSFFQSSVYNNTKDFGCTSTCNIIGFPTDFCSETCAFRDICSTCDANTNYTCAAECFNNTWTSRQDECPLPPTPPTSTGDVTTTGISITGTSSTTGSSGTCSSVSSATLGSSFQDTFSCCYAFNNPTIPTFTIPASGNTVLNSPANPLVLYDGTALLQGCNGQAFYYENTTGVYTNVYSGTDGAIKNGIDVIYASQSSINVRNLQSWQSNLPTVLNGKNALLFITCNNGLSSCVRMKFSDVSTSASSTGSTATTGAASTTGIHVGITTGDDSSSAPTEPEVPEEIVPQIESRVTVRIATSPLEIDLPKLIGELTQFLAIPSTAISRAVVDMDTSTKKKTDIELTIWNEKYANGTRVNPVVVAYTLKTMTKNELSNLEDSSSYLNQMTAVNPSMSSASSMSALLSLIALCVFFTF